MATASPVEAQGLHCTATDGDTLRCGPKRVRIIGLDAPERHGECPVEIALAGAARDRLGVLVKQAYASLYTAGTDPGDFWRW